MYRLILFIMLAAFGATEVLGQISRPGTKRQWPGRDKNQWIGAGLAVKDSIKTFESIADTAVAKSVQRRRGSVTGEVFNAHEKGLVDLLTRDSRETFFRVNPAQSGTNTWGYRSGSFGTLVQDARFHHVPADSQATLRIAMMPNNQFCIVRSLKKRYSELDSYHGLGLDTRVVLTRRNKTTNAQVDVINLALATEYESGNATDLIDSVYYHVSAGDLSKLKSTTYNWDVEVFLTETVQAGEPVFGGLSFAAEDVVGKLVSDNLPDTVGIHQIFTDLVEFDGRLKIPDPATPSACTPTNLATIYYDTDSARFKGCRVIGSTSLSANTTTSSTTITVASTADFPANGQAWIGTDGFNYTGKTSTTFTGVTNADAKTTGAVVRAFAYRNFAGDNDGDGVVEDFDYNDNDINRFDRAKVVAGVLALTKTIGSQTDVHFSPIPGQNLSILTLTQAYFNLGKACTEFSPAKVGLWAGDTYGATVNGAKLWEYRRSSTTLSADLNPFSYNRVYAGSFTWNYPNSLSCYVVAKP